MTTALRRLLTGLSAAVLLATSPALAADAPVDESRWGFKSLFGFGQPGGDYGNGLEKFKEANFEFYRKSPKGNWRYGLGLGFGSFAMKAPYSDLEEFGLLRTYAFGTKVFRADKGIRPYVELQGGLARAHPRSLLFAIRPLPEDLEIGDSPTRPANGFFVGIVPGVEISLTRSLALDASVQITGFHTDEYDLSPIGQPPASSGSTFSGRLGLSWVPGGGGEGPRDAWGVPRSYGWAIGETLAINHVASRRNEYKRNANFNQISPRSWWHNISSGFDYDDNQFRTNQLNHPFNGSTYFNSARANGHGFWVSSASSVAGAYVWECCGETHPMSFNDMISTGIGGMALGEMMFRMSSKILDGSKTGKGRFFREAGAFLVDPIRGLNRIVSGRASSTDNPNPSNPMDWRPPGGGSFLALGARTIGRGESISENTKTTGYFEYTHAYGNAFDNERNKPFDSFDLTLQFNFGDKVPLGQAQVVGTLYKKTLGGDTHPGHVFEVAQHFDYMNNEDYEFGGQSFGPALLSRFDLGTRWSVHTRVDGTVMLLGAINSEYAKIAQVGDRERLREYDYGPGLGAAARATLAHGGRPLLQAAYRFQWINVSNGSVYNNDALGISTSAEHYIQMAGLRLTLPIRGSVGIGADGTVFFRQSRYSLPQFTDIDQRNPQARLYLTINGIRE